MTSIKPLPEAARNSMRSGIVLSDLTRVVEELVFNSLDAGATKVIKCPRILVSFLAFDLILLLYKIQGWTRFVDEES